MRPSHGHPSPSLRTILHFLRFFLLTDVVASVELLEVITCVFVLLSASFLHFDDVGVYVDYLKAQQVS